MTWFCSKVVARVQDTIAAFTTAADTGLNFPFQITALLRALNYPQTPLPDLGWL